MLVRVYHLTQQAVSREAAFKEGLKEKQFQEACAVCRQHASQAQEDPRQETPSQSQPRKRGLLSSKSSETATTEAPTSPQQRLLHMTVTVASSHSPKREEREHQTLTNPVMDLELILMLTSPSGLDNFFYCLF